MTSMGLLLKRTFINQNAPLNNGAGRFVPQLARLTIKFCKSHGSSQGVRRFIEEDIVQFAKNNPGTVIYLKPRRHRSPVLVAEYLNGEKHHQSLSNYGVNEVSSYVDFYRNQSGVEYSDQQKNTYSDHPSIQGYWNPHTHQEPGVNFLKYPVNKPAILHQPSATEIVRNAFISQQEGNEFSPGEEEKLEARKQTSSS
eukprot:TRINITY_DN23292_c0_g2_i1.p1 TRINITY_DN23292_c0_g2~~TRINITY_DN23292_c0_g2_i1.p1  ORF type:complete len:197 (+),score=14.82 TRINITY_DN23292_c0_g2_i1:49-639(+)